MKKTIYFLCTGNSCRSQMAEGYGKKLLGDRAEVFSAGIEAHGKNPRAIQVMTEDDVDISEQESSMIDPAILERASLVITLCGNADERCPAIPGTAERMHWGLDDPAKATGSEEEIMAEFRRVRDEVRSRISKLEL